jgi:glutamate-ammonia-ligase adenylyltransferase
MSVFVHQRGEAVRAVSRSLGRFLDDDQEASNVLAEPALPGTERLRVLFQHALGAGGIEALTLVKRRRLLQIAAWDLSGSLGLEETIARLANLADACLDATLIHIDARDAVSVVAMGKLGARELNYFSDIDLMFVASGDLSSATRAADYIVNSLGGHTTGHPYIIDPNLRPEGRSGPLVRTLDGYLEYYRRWAQPWELQALIKARRAAGSEVGDELIASTRELVYPLPVPAERIAAIRRVKERVEAHVARPPRRGRARGEDVKLGPGGIRDIEFAVQLLQLVHGGADETVRVRATLPALTALVEGAYIADDDGAGLGVAYTWLRTVEHRMQLWQERRVRELPRNPEERARLARALRFTDSPEASALTRFDDAHSAVLADVRGRFEKLFYRPMIEALAEPGGGRLAAQGVEERLRLLGFRQVERAGKILGAMVAGTSRRAKLIRVLSPPLLRHLSSTPFPDEGLVSFLRLAESLDTRLDVLGGLRDNPPGIALLARVLGTGRVAGELLMQVPEEIQTIADPARPSAAKGRERSSREAKASLEWRLPEQRLAGLRRFKRREELRLVVSDLAGEANAAEVGARLADLADACLGASLEEGAPPFAVVGLGKLGGRELSYSSDLDVVFIHAGDPLEAERLAEDLVHALGETTEEGHVFRVDAGLRPEGRAGVLSRSLDSYRQYYEKWGRPWERLALTKARFAAGSETLGTEFIALLRRFTYSRPPGPGELQEIRHLKVRMERERIARGSDPRRHLKLGPGGTSDIDFAIGLLQLEHGHQQAELRVTGTLSGIHAARRCNLLSPEDAERLSEAYLFLSQLRNRLYLMSGRPVDVLPDKPETLEALGTAMGFEEQPRQDLEESYLRLTRRARRAAAPLIFG